MAQLDLSKLGDGGIPSCLAIQGAEFSTIYDIHIMILNAKRRGTGVSKDHLTGPAPPQAHIAVPMIVCHSVINERSSENILQGVILVISKSIEM